MNISNMETSSYEDSEKEFKFKVPCVPCVRLRRKSSKPKVEEKVTETRCPCRPIYENIKKYQRLMDTTMKKINEGQNQLAKCGSSNEKMELLKLIMQIEEKHWAYVKSFYRYRRQLQTTKLNNLILEISKTVTSSS